MLIELPGFFQQSEMAERQHRAELRRVLADAWRERAAWLASRLHDEAEARPSV